VNQIESSLSTGRAGADVIIETVCWALDTFPPQTVTEMVSRSGSKTSAFTFASKRRSVNSVAADDDAAQKNAVALILN